MNLSHAAFSPRSVVRIARMAALITVLTGPLAGPVAGSVSASSTGPSTTAPDPEPESRFVVALTNEVLVGTGSDGKDIVHDSLETPLNYLGLVVRRHHIDDGPPPAGWLEDARAIVTYFTWKDAGPEWLMPWLEGAKASHDLKIVHVGSLQPMFASSRAEPERVRRWLTQFGLLWDDCTVNDALRANVQHVDNNLTAWEAEAWRDVGLRGPHNTSPDNTPWLKVADRLFPDDVRSPVVTGPWGGLALDPWVLSMGSYDNERRWHVDPYRFLRKALDVGGIPAPHPAMAFGRRMFVFHVDGDGFESLSSIRRGAYAADVFYEEILSAYDLPFTVSIVVASLTDSIAPEEPTERMRLASRMFELENVEAASHAVLHPLRWDLPLLPSSPPRTVAWYDGLEGYTYDTVAEVAESIRFINDYLTPPGKVCEVMLWSGYANPSEEAIAEAARQGCWNLNGGVYRNDAMSDSLAFVSPLGRNVGDVWQIYAGAANENDFEGFFTTMPGAFGHIDTTIQRSGEPYVLKPANIYVHFYSAENRSRLDSLHRLIRRWAMEEPTVPVFASTYAHAAHSALTEARVLRTANGWSLRDFGGCMTARLDGEERHIDWNQSSGLAGAVQRDDALFVHLAEPDAELVFSPTPVLVPHVREANHLVEDVRLSPEVLSLRSSALHARELLLAGFTPNTAVDVAIDGTATEHTTDGAGHLALSIDGPGDTLVEVRTR